MGAPAGHCSRGHRACLACRSTMPDSVAFTPAHCTARSYTMCWSNREHSCSRVARGKNPSLRFCRQACRRVQCSTVCYANLLAVGLYSGTLTRVSLAKLLGVLLFFDLQNPIDWSRLISNIRRSRSNGDWDSDVNDLRDHRCGLPSKFTSASLSAFPSTHADHVSSNDCGRDSTIPIKLSYTDGSKHNMSSMP